MFRPTGFRDLVGHRVGVFGLGVEGRATLERLAADGVVDVVAVDDLPSDVPGALRSDDGGLRALTTCDVVIKSPGIPRRRDDVVALERAGVTVTSALNLWLHEVDRSRVIAVTGTKGKSTTTALINWLLCALGQPSHSVGNIGQPPYAPSFRADDGWLVLEVSSFQCVDLDVAPATVVVTALGSDHLDWHGSLDQYHDDKLSITRAAGAHRTLTTSAVAEAFAAQLGGELEVVTAPATTFSHELGYLGRHNAWNVALALTCVARVLGRTVDDVTVAVTPHLATHHALPGRLSLVWRGRVGDAEWRIIDDGLATSPLPVIAALEVFADEPVALFVGGFDRGVDYAPLADALRARRAPTALVVNGPAGARVVEEFALTDLELVRSDSFDEAFPEIFAWSRAGGVALLSPGAPSFHRYANWKERSDDFRRAALAAVSSTD